MPYRQWREWQCFTYRERAGECRQTLKWVGQLTGLGRLFKGRPGAVNFTHFLHNSLSHTRHSQRIPTHPPNNHLDLWVFVCVSVWERDEWVQLKMTVSNLTISYFCLLPNFLTQKKTSTNYKLPCDLFLCFNIIFRDSGVLHLL